MTAHTPGRWRVFTGPGSGNNGSRKTRVWTANGDHLVADCGLSETLDLAARQANARLIAQAPEMFDVLLRLAGGMDLLEHTMDVPAHIRDQYKYAVYGETRERLLAVIRAATVDPPKMIPEGAADEPV
jgi:hypothetical protein